MSILGKPKKTLRLTALAAAILIGAATGFAATSATASAVNAENKQGERVSKPFAKNAQGETFGSAMDAASPADEPDLIRAVGDGGTIGYVKKADLDQGQPKSPEEAVAFEASKKDKASKGRVLNLYAEDGKTVIGTKTVGSPAPDSKEKRSQQPQGADYRPR